MWGIFYKILSVPHNIVMDLNNVMKRLNLHVVLIASSTMPNGHGLHIHSYKPFYVGLTLGLGVCSVFFLNVLAQKIVLNSSHLKKNPRAT